MASKCIGPLLETTVIGLVEAGCDFDYMDIDGIICIQGSKEGQQIVVKIHHKSKHCNEVTDENVPCDPANRVYMNTLNSAQSTSVAANSRSPYEGKNMYSSPGYRKESSTIHYPADPSSMSPKGYLTEAQHMPNLASYSNNSGPSPVSVKNTVTPSPTLRGPPPLKRAPGAKISQGMHKSPPPPVDPPEPPSSPKIAKAPKVSILGDKKKSEKKLNKKVHVNSMYTGRVANRPINALPDKMTCGECKLDFTDVKEYSSHFQEQHGTYMCHICLKTFSNPSNRARHVKLHTGELSHICNICGHGFSRVDLLKEHTRRHVTPFPFKCNICDKSYGARKALKNHIERVHGTQLTHQCRHCCMGFHDAAAYKKHLEEEHGNSTSQPDEPSKEMKYGDEIHCKICGFTCYDVLSIAKHELIHSEETKYNCVSCSQDFLDPIQFSLHFEDHSAEAGVFECCFCHQMIGSYHELLIHEATHVTGKPGLKVCVLCCNVIPESEVLADHMLMCSQSMTNTSSPVNNKKENCSESDPFIPLDSAMDWDEAEEVVKKSLDATEDEQS